MDIVYIEGLKIAATIGVWEWEQRIKQNLNFDIELETDIRKSAQSCNLEDTVSYKDVSARIVDFVSSGEFKLIETVAENVANIILTEFPVQRCKVKISKPRAVESASSVGIVIERSSQSAS